MRNAAVTVHIIDDDAALGVAMLRLLDACGYRVALYDSCEAFLAANCCDSAGCIVLDVNMPGQSGLQLQEYLVHVGCILPIIFMTGFGDIPMSVRAIKAGAEDFLVKPVEKADLLDAIERALQRHALAAAQQRELSVLREREASLTARERQVFTFVIRGMLNKQIACALGNTERTVKAQRRCVMEKMAAHSVAELVRMGGQLGLAEVPRR